MSDDPKEVVRSVFCEVVEKMAFMFADPADAAELDTAGDTCLHSTIEFSGALRGKLEMMAPQGLCVMFAANVLGLDADDPLCAQRAADAVSETLNVTCGHVLTAMAGQTPVFELKAPVTNAVGPEAWAAFRQDPAVQGFLVDDAPALLRVTLA
ncbi:MAG TPA: chemotaxis protein CheX [Anaerolineae bacterium]|nr:chemotaxis protein CheX [Anaerolineae bacterium]